jgi:bis(5'-nucleosidyl)-tetraphosphatase
MARVRRDSSAGVIVFRRDDGDLRFLLLKSRQTRRPIWEFPKGGVAQGETPRTAALRELQEETGIPPAHVRLIPGFQRTEHYRFTVRRESGGTAVRKRVIYFLGETDRDDVKISPDEASDFAWLEATEAVRRVRYPQRRRILTAAIEHLGDPRETPPPPVADTEQ